MDSDSRLARDADAHLRADWASVIIPTYNRSELVMGSIESVFQQTYRPIELIVVDDGSTDDTFSRLLDWKRENSTERHFAVRLLRQRNGGAAAARNHGMRQSHGEYLQFLDSDCRLHPDKLSQQIAVLSQSEAGYCSCITDFVDSSGIVRYSIGSPPGHDLILEAVSANLTCISPLWKQRVVGSIVWDEDLPCLEDWVFKLRVLCHGAKGEFLPAVLCQAVLHEGERVSRHHTSDFVSAQEKAVLRAHSLVEQLENNTMALNHLGALLLSTCKAYLRLREFERADSALNRCLAIAPRKTLKMRLIWALNTWLGSSGLWRVLRTAGQI